MPAEPGSAPRHARWLAALTALLALALSLGVVELAFRLVGFDFEFKQRAFQKTPVFYRQPVVRSGKAFFRRPGPDRWQGRPLTLMMRQKGIPEPYLPVGEQEVTISYDADGFRNPDNLDEWEIVVAGDSFTELGYLPYEQLFTTRLGERLGVRVKNLGVSYSGSFAHAHFLTRYGRAPSLRHAVLAFFEGNDLTDATVEALRFQQVQEREAQGEPAPFGESLLEDLEPQSSFVRALLQLVRGRPENPVDRLFFPNATFVHGAERTAVTVYFAPPGRSELAPKQLELLERALLAWRRNSHRLGAKPWLLYLPAKLRVLHGRLEFWENARPRVVAWQPSDLPEAVHEAAVRHGIAFVDPTPALRADAAAGRMPYNPVWDTHFSASGCETLARVLADAMRADVTAGAPPR